MKHLKSHVRHDDPEIMSISHIHVLLLSSAISLIVSLTLPSRFPVLVLKLPITSVHLLTLLLLICFTLGKCFLAMEVPPSSWLCPHRSSWLSGTSSHAQVGSNVVRDLLKGIFFVRIQWLVVILMSFLHLNLTLVCKFGGALKQESQNWWQIHMGPTWRHLLCSTTARHIVSTLHAGLPQHGMGGMCRWWFLLCQWST